jgi:Ca-activated chloride channel family protein
LEKGLSAGRGFEVNLEFPWMLLLIACPLLLARFGWNRVDNRLFMLMKAGSLAALILALSGPTIVVTHYRQVGLAIVLDTSADATAALADGLVDHKEVGWTRVLSFAESAEKNNIERILRDAAAQVPEGYASRVLLLSDGTAARGDLARAVTELQQMHVAVDTMPLTWGPSQKPRLDFVQVPSRVYAGERFPLDLAVVSPIDTQAQIDLGVGDGGRAAQSIHLQRGSNLIRAHERTLSTGAVLIAGRLSADGMEQVAFEHLLQVNRARVAYVSERSTAAEALLLRLLRLNGAEIERDPFLKATAKAQLVVLSGEDLSVLSASEKVRLAGYVKDGGGLLLLGGEGAPFRDKSEMDALDQVLPATLAPPQNAGDKCVVMLIDKSSSMAGPKIKMAQQSVLAIADSLGPDDSVGVLAFNHANRWIIPIQKFRNRRLLVQEISSLTADGGTEIPRALSAAYHAALLSKAKYRHLVLVTDGISVEGDSVRMAQDAFRQGIAISTVGLGTAVNRSFLEAVATASGGRSYFLSDPKDLKRITLKDVRDYLGTNSVDRLSRAIARRGNAVLEGVDIRKAPALTRYTRYITRPGANQVLAIGEGGRDPLYVQWQYGMGKVGLFTSDAISEWAGSWKDAAEFDRLWANIVQDLFSRAKVSEVNAAACAGSENLQIRYSLGPNATEAPVPEILVLGPDGFKKQASVEQVTPASYIAKVSIGARSGIFRVVSDPPSAAFPSTAVLVRQGGEANPSADRKTLQQIAKLTGGNFYGDPTSRPSWHAELVKSRIRLWPGLVCLAIVLNLVELMGRRKIFIYF